MSNRKTILVFMPSIIFLLYLTFPNLVLATNKTNLNKTALTWEDYSVEFKKQIRFEGPKTIWLTLPTELIENNDFLEFTIQNIKTDNNKKQLVLIINDYQAAKFVFGGNGFTKKTIKVKSDYLNGGKNKLYFYCNSIFPQFSYIDSISLKGISKSNHVTSTKMNKQIKSTSIAATTKPIHDFSTSTKQTAINKNPDAIAVVIGNQNYSHKDIPPVKYASNDATAVRKYLIETLGYKDGNIIFEPDTTKAKLEMIFGTVSNHRGVLYNYIKPEKSDVFIYYSGHGSPDPQTNKAYLVPVDCNPVMMDLTAYPLDVMYGNLPKIEAKRITVVLDACFSGGTDTGKFLVQNASPALIKVKNPVTAQNNITIFTSAKNNQVSSWYPEKQHSMFTYFFLTAVTGSADFNQDSQITYQEIYDFVADRAEGVPYYAKRLHGGRIQNPTMQAANKDAVFVEF